MLVVLCTRALISGSASVARSAACDACNTPQARKAPAGSPGRYYDIPGMREYAPENQVTDCVETPPEPRKDVYQDALGCLGAETS